MVKKKDIGKVFKEQLEGFEKSPENISWEMIESQLHTDQGPKSGFWIRFTILISFLLLIIGGGTYIYLNHIPNQNKDQEQNSNITDINRIEDCEETTKMTNKRITKKTISTINTNAINTKTPSDTTIAEQPITDIHNSKDGNTKKNSITKTKLPNLNTSIYTQQKPSNHKMVNQNNIVSPSATKEEAAKQVTYSKLHSQRKGQVIWHTTTSNSYSKEESSKVPENSDATNNAEPDKGNPKNTTNAAEKELASITKKNNVRDLINTSEEDSITMSEKGKDLLKGQKKDTLIYLEPLKEEYKQKWTLGLHLIPTYSFAIGNYNLSNSLTNNTINGRLVLNYGIRVSTPLGKKTTLRFGYNSLRLGTKTKNLSRDQLSATTRDMGIVLPSNANLSAENNFKLTQNIKYHELSSELNYYITDWKDFKISGIGGFSFLLLKGNEVNISSSAIEINDSAINLSDFNTSFNFGSNIRYQLSDRIELYVDPIFKYQLFKSTQNLNNNYPLYFTIQTGISIEFD